MTSKQTSDPRIYMKKISVFILGLGLIAFAAAIWFVARAFPSFEKQERVEVEVVLEKVKSVAKLVTVEGYFSEIFDYKDYYQWDIPILRKKALIRVKARASIGYDLQQITLTSDPDKQQIVLSNLPRPTLLSLEHDLDYYDISEGTFNAFREEDFNTINARAKSYISEVAMSSDLAQIAESRRDEAFEMMRFFAESAGWTLVIEDRQAETPLAN